MQEFSKTKICLCSSQTPTCWTCECDLASGRRALVCSVKRKVTQILICLCLVGWSVLTQLSSTPSSWCCTRWPAVCPRRPAAALPATSLPAPTATCQVGQEDGAVVPEMYRTTPKKWLIVLMITIRLTRGSYLYRTINTICFYLKCIWLVLYFNRPHYGHLQV